MNGRPGNPDSGMRINLLVSRTQQPHFDNTRIVQIEKPVNGLGFNIVGGEVDRQGIISRIGKAFLSRDLTWLVSKFFKDSSDQSHFIFEIFIGKSRIRHRTTLKLNF